MRKVSLPDGGLYIPTRLPAVDAGALSRGIAACRDVARAALDGFFAGDRLQPALGDIADAALDLPAPTTAVAAARIRCSRSSCYHGPTAAFKDFGARFLAESLQRLETQAPPAD